MVIGVVIGCCCLLFFLVDFCLLLFYFENNKIDQLKLINGKQTSFMQVKRQYKPRSNRLHFPGKEEEAKKNF